MNTAYTQSDGVSGSDSVSCEQHTISVDQSLFSSYSNICSRFSPGSEILRRIKELHKYHNDSYQYKIYMEGVMDVVNLMDGFRNIEEIDWSDKYTFTTATSSGESNSICTQDPETSNENSEETEEDIDIVE